MTKKGPIVRATSEDLRTSRARRESGSDWDRAADVAVPDGNDPDDAIEPVDVDRVIAELPRRKVHATLELDADVLEWFRAQGRGCNTRINAILRTYFERHSQSR